MTIKDDWDRLCKEVRDEAAKCIKQCPEEKVRFEKDSHNFCYQRLPKSDNRIAELRSIRNTMFSEWHSITGSHRRNKFANG